MIDFRKAIIQHIEDNQRTFTTNRSLTVGASEVFDCIRRAYFSKHKPELADKSVSAMGKAARGQLTEDHFIVPFLEAKFGKANVLFAGSDQKTFVTGKSSATPDALIINQPDDSLAEYGIPSIGPGRCFMVEVKSFDPMMHIEEEKYVHRGQGITQMGHVRLHTPYKPEAVIILYVNASDLYDIRPYAVAFSESTFKIAQERSELVFATKDAYDLEPEGIAMKRCEYCPFWATCQDTELEHYPSEGDEIDATDVSEMMQGDIDNIVDMSAQYLSLTTRLKKDSEVKDSLGQKIRRELNELGLKKLRAGGLSIAYSKMNGRLSLNQSAMIEDGINLEQYKQPGKGFTKLSVRPVKDQ